MSTFNNSLRLSGRTGDSFVLYPTDDEDQAMVVSIRSILPTGEVSLSFQGDDYSVWRGNIYTKGGMNGK